MFELTCRDVHVRPDLITEPLLRHSDGVSITGSEQLSMSAFSTLVAGGNPWRGSGEQHEAWQRMIAVAEVIALGAGAMALWRHDLSARPGVLAVAICGTAALALLMVLPISRAFGMSGWPQRFGVALVIRVLLMSIAVASLGIVLPGWASLWALPIAIGAGADAVLTCNEIGWTPRPFTWWRRFLVSPAHALAVGALLVVVATNSGSGMTALIAVACFHVWLLTTSASAWVLSELGRLQAAERSKEIDDVIALERRQRAHWLHDDVCAELHAVALRLQTSDLGPQDAVHLIEEVDHRLRIRQLEELLDSGRARVGEILQPFIRKVHNSGVAITAVPSFEACATMLPARAARLVSRAAMELTTNALEAGATEIAYGVDIDDQQGRLRLTVLDNGPGFGMSQVPTGKALWTLQRELAGGGISITSSPSGGAAVTAELLVREGSDGGNAPSGR